MIDNVVIFKPEGLGVSVGLLVGVGIGVGTVVATGVGEGELMGISVAVETGAGEAGEA